MSKGLFSGWREVFGFTFRQDTKGKFRKSTTIVALLLLAAGMSISIIMAAVQKKDSRQISPIQVVHIVNESDLVQLPLEVFGARSERNAFPDTKLVIEQESTEKLAERLQGQPYDTILRLRRDGEGYQMTMILPPDRQVSEGECEDLLESFSDVLETAKLMASGIEAEKLGIAISGVRISTREAGVAEKSIGEELVAMLLPMIIVLVMYLFTLVYGLTMGNAVSVEKTSKLMEMMLTMTRPYGMILGKILALFVAAVAQLFVWIAGFGVGFVLGDLVAKNIVYPEYHNMIIEALELLGQQNVGSAFSPGACLLGALSIAVGILFFCLAAAALGSIASKTEEVAQYMSYYQVLVVLGFLGAYMIPMQEKPWLSALCRLVPVCSAFMLPGDILVGNITLLQGGLYLLLLAAFTIGLVFVAGRIYRNQLFYRGQRAKSGR